ncbi:MFS transporter [Methanocorpusculum vombati]|uniref:MFS transporter n=1 Tax=Methanocorpusculum vombati TaxID=3002864 RepID=A0ABT4IKG2_9EURY|nr:MFS transporter [Methanocorpusculum vombati]MCZ9320095.1 MFS transporter [Methanocorpusculum sp.]MCZ0862226.1 MFS transporter [Methanocorpusculum vombati]MDE2519704.1 MFS transporter [Methanocorpusculum sp.]MDE2534514.1 MFS transporter [Methanocorpusculum sp.]MDE2546505.1 MFS transporter [Methanocorpusculum sp.]
MDNNQIYTGRKLLVILLAVTLASFLTPIYTSMVNIAIPAIGESFAVPAETLAMLSTAYLISSVVFLVPAARLADIFGLRKVFVGGLCLAALAAFTAPFSISIGMLLACQVVAGIGFACVISNAIALLSIVYPPSRRGAAIGIAVAGVYLGLTAGPLIGGALTSVLGWPSIYVFVLLLCLATAVMVRFSIRAELFTTPGQPFDLRGSVLYGVMVLFLMFGLINLPDPLAVAGLVFGVVLLLIFISFEAKTRYPVFPVRLFTENRVFARANITTMINYGATFAVSFFMSLYLQVIGALTPMEAGFVMIAMPVVQMIFSPVAGKLSDTIGGRVLMTTGLVVTGIGMAMFGFIGTEYNPAAITLNLAVIGFGIALFGAPNTNLVLGSVDRRDSGSANSILATMRQMGMVISMAAATCCIILFTGAGAELGSNPGGLVAAMHLTFALGAVLSFAGAVVGWTAVPAKR